MKRFSIGLFLNILNRNTQDWKKQMDFIKQFSGVDHIEVLLEETNIQPKELIYLQELLKPYSVLIHAPFMDLALLSPHEKIRNASQDILAKALAIGAKLNAQTITIHLERYPHFWSELQAQDTALAAIETLHTISTIPFAIENLSKGGNTQIPFPSTPQQILQLMQKFPVNTGLTIDIGHVLKDDYDLFSLLEQTITHTYNMHLHDAHKGAAHLSLGQGELDIEKYFSFLQTTNYDKFVSLEVLGEEDIANSWEKVEKFIR